MSFKRVISEIHRRSLWQVLLVYLGASWGVLQVIDQVQSRLALPDWVYGAALIVLLVGLPIVLATAFVQEGPAPAPTAELSGLHYRVFTWRNALGVGAVILILGGGLVGWLSFGPRTDEGAIHAKSIAVLPLANLSTDADDAFFTDGIHDEILTHLSRIAQLDVRSRTSVLEYKNSTKNLKQVARELGVRYILEGSVRRAGTRTRITAQLIDANTDKHLWAETYDGTRDDIFAMQTSVAEKIAASLAAELSPAERSRLNTRPTKNADAYDLYLRALEYSQRDYSRENFNFALDLVHDALALDPDFAVAHALEAFVLGFAYWFHYDRSEAIQSRMLAAARRALELDPELPDAHHAMANYYYRVKLDYERALKEIVIARTGAPGSARYALDHGSILRRQGDVAEAIPHFEKALELDPRSALVAMNLGEAYRLVRRYDDAKRVFERGTSISPDLYDVPLSYAEMHLLHTGDLAAARRITERVTARARGSRSLDHERALIELFDRKPDAALAVLNASLDTAYQSQFFYVPKAMLIGEAYTQKRDAQKARAHFTAAVAELTAALRSLPNDPRLYVARGLAYAELGQKREAIADGVRATEIMPLAKEAWRGGLFEVGLAKIYARTGEAEKAIAILQRLLDRPADIGRGGIRVDPAWDPIRTHPRFKDLKS